MAIVKWADDSPEAEKRRQKRIKPVVAKMRKMSDEALYFHDLELKRMMRALSILAEHKRRRR